MKNEIYAIDYQNYRGSIRRTIEVWAQEIWEKFERNKYISS